MLTEPHVFPREAPPGYSYLDDEPPFEPAKDLRLEPPKTLTELAELGYDEDFGADYPSPLAITSPLRVLSDSGVEKLRYVIKRLWPYAIHSPDPRVAPVIKGAAYRSRFVRDLSLSPEVAEFLGECAGTPLVPSAFPFKLGHINYAHCGEGEEPVDGWHHDDNGFVMVLTVHDQSHLEGGRFQYFDGTRQEASALLGRGLPLPEGRVVSPEFPGPGYAVLMQGSALVHRTEPMYAPGERFTMGTCYEARDVRYPDPNRTYFVRQTADSQNAESEDERFCRYLDYARHKAWRARGHLDDFINDAVWTDDREAIVRQLAEAVREIVEAVDHLRRGEISEREVRRLRAADEARRKRRVN